MEENSHLLGSFQILLEGLKGAVEEGVFLLHSLKYLRFFPNFSQKNPGFMLSYGICNPRWSSKVVLLATGKENTERKI